jgi:uncharacterized glyoxalase superfamily protein PhnB
MNTTNFKLYRVIIPVKNIEKAVGFYQSLFRKDGMRVSRGRHYFDLGGTILACYDPKADGDDTFDWKFHENQYVYISTNNLREVYQSVMEVGGALTSEIEEMSWGERLFYAKDIVGTPICFVDSKSVFWGDN